MFWLLAGPVAAQDVVGTSIVTGKRVELLSDHTWRFTEARKLPATCIPVNARIAFCGSPLEWWPSSTSGTDFLRVFRHDDRTYAGMIYEGIGEDDGLMAEVYRELIIRRTADVAGVGANEIPVLSSTATEVEGIAGETLVYGARLAGIAMVFMNTVIVQASYSAQFVTWSLGKEQTAEHVALHAAFLDAIDMTGPEESR